MTYEWAREKALNVARSILEGDVGIIEGARLLSSFGHELVPDWTVDPDFVVLGALDSETDHLPVGAERKLWEQKALAERDAIVSRIEAEAKEEVESACRNILRRFAAA
jgi:hypothetical protein